MAQVAYIFSGYEAGSVSTEVYCDMPSGTPIKLYQHEDLLGTGVLGTNKRCIITHLPLQDTGYSLEAYPIERLGFSQAVSGSDTILTGWVVPSEVNDNGIIITYQAWKLLSETNPERYREIADLFKPSLTLNTNPDKDSLLQLAKGKLIFSSSIDNQNGRTTISIAKVLNAYGGYTVQFDDGAIGTSLAKSYTVSGIYKVKVVDLDNASNFLEETFTVTIYNAPTAPPTTIGQLFYTPTYSIENPSAGFAKGYCTSQVEFKLNGAIPNGWVDGEGGENNFWVKIFDNVASGINYIECRVKNNIADTKTAEFIQ
jgi:hypothetical protein